MKLTRILAPTDFSRFSGFALEWAVNLAEALRAELILLHVVPEEEGKIIEEVIGEGAAVQIPRGVRENVLEERQKKFREQFQIVLPEHLKKSLRVEEILRIGVPFLEIVKAVGGKFIDVKSSAELEAAFKEIDRLEPSLVEVAVRGESQELYPLCILFALGFLFSLTLLQNTFFLRLC